MCSVMDALSDDVGAEIREERRRQDAKWGEQNHAPPYWLSILMEEVGETSMAMLQQKAADYRKELVQIAAVCVAAIESFDRGHNLHGHMGADYEQDNMEGAP